MLIKPPLEKLLPKVECRYTLAMLVAKRTRQLVDGAQPMIESDSPNLVTLACEEIAAGKVICVEGSHNPTVPLRPEVEEARRLARELAANQASLDAFPELMDLSPAPVGEDDAEDRVLFNDLINSLDGEAGDLIGDSSDSEAPDDIITETPDAEESSETEE